MLSSRSYVDIARQCKMDLSSVTCQIRSDPVRQVELESVICQTVSDMLDCTVSDIAANYYVMLCRRPCFTARKGGLYCGGSAKTVRSCLTAV